MKKRSVVPAMFLAIIRVVSSAGLSAQEFPSRTITMVVPFAPGGPTDVIARTLAVPMSTTLGRSSRRQASRPSS